MEEKLRKEREEKEFYDVHVLHIPYIKNFSGYIQKELRKINVRVVMKKSATIQSRVCRGMKQRRTRKR